MRQIAINSATYLGALVLTGALVVYIGPYFGVWILYWMTHFLG